MSSTRATILLSVASAAAAILTVYFTVGTAVERDIVQRQTKMVVRSLLFGLTLPESTMQRVKSLVPVPNAAADATAAASNRSVRNHALLVVGALLAVSYMVAKRWAGPRMFPAVLRAAMMSGALAAGTELSFLLLVARNYDSADPNTVRLQILQQLQAEQT